jgi:hypothetical protein
MAIYCSNTRANYLLRATNLNHAVLEMKKLDTKFDQFMAHALCFEPGHETTQHREAYELAAQQLRLGIKQGGIGLASNTLTAPAASYVALRDFTYWYAQPVELWGDNALHNLSWLKQQTTAQGLQGIYFPIVKNNLDTAAAQLQSMGDIHADGNDTRSQNIISCILKDKVHKDFQANLSADGKIRLKAISQQTVPTAVTSSDLQPPTNNEEDSLSYTPMALMALVCPFELSNEAFITVLSIQLGTPTPHARFLRNQVRGYQSYDVWGDCLLNNPDHAASSSLQIVSQ